MGMSKIVIRSDVFRLTIPIVTEQVFVMSMGAVNTVLASRIGKEAVSAIGMVDSINNILIAFFSSLAVGSTVVVAQYAGQGKIREANETVKQALFSGLLLSVIVTAVLWIFQVPLMNSLFGSADERVMQYSYTYLGITLFTYPFISLTAIACGVLRGAGDTKTPMAVTVFMNVVNIILSYVLIYGLRINIFFIDLYIPRLEVMGAALGIAIARAIGTAIIMFILFNGSKIIKLTGLKQFKIDSYMQRSIFSVGLPAGIESLLFNGGKLITQIFIVGLGTVAIASNSIANSIFSLVNIPGNAFSIAATTMVGQSMGKGDSDEARDTLLYLTKVSILCMLALCVVSFIFARPLVAIYSRDADVISLSTLLMRLCSISTPILWPAAFVLPAGLKGAGDAKYTLLTSMIGMWAFRVVLGYIFCIPLKMGVAGIWIGMFVDWLVRGALYYSRLRGDKWKSNTVIKAR
jgi:putative MATE family efflux protein